VGCGVEYVRQKKVIKFVYNTVKLLVQTNELTCEPPASHVRQVQLGQSVNTFIDMCLSLSANV